MGAQNLTRAGRTASTLKWLLACSLIVGACNDTGDQKPAGPKAPESKTAESKTAEGKTPEGKARDTKALVARLKTDRGLASGYKDHCRAVCQVHMSMCSEDCMASPPDGEDCNSVCNDSHLSCRTKCSASDKECIDACNGTYYSCADTCPSHNFCTNCGEAYMACLDGCEQTPECFDDSDCGPDYICSSHDCIRAPACVTSESCPKDDSYTCFDGHCYPI